jgi:small subunit ribosomal protein S16
MAMKIRLTRMGSKKKPFYRVVAVNSETRRDGRALDFLGYYNPMTEPADIKIDEGKVREWMAKGAKPTDTVRSLLAKAGISLQAAS